MSGRPAGDVRTTLVEAARSAARTKNTYLSAQYHRLSARRGGNRAAVAVAHTILVVIYHMLKGGTPHQELGADYFDKLNHDAVARRAIKRLEALSPARAQLSEYAVSNSRR